MRGRTFRRLSMPALFLMLVRMLGSCAQMPSSKIATTPSDASETTKGFVRPELLVDTDWLAQHLNDARVRVVIVRKPADYRAEHIKNSVNLDTMDSKGPMYDQDNPVKWAVLPKDKLEGLLSDLGISNDTIVVAVDDAQGLLAGQLFWTLEYYGHSNGKARVLDGKLKQWQTEKRELTTEVPQVQKAIFVARVDPSKLATKQQILKSLGEWGNDPNTPHRAIGGRANRALRVELPSAGYLPADPYTRASLPISPRWIHPAEAERDNSRRMSTKR